MVQEVALAITWVLKIASSLGGNPNRVTVMGHSAGAQLGLMALVQRAQQQQQDRNSADDAAQFMPAAFLGDAL